MDSFTLHLNKYIYIDLKIMQVLIEITSENVLVCIDILHFLNKICYCDCMMKFQNLNVVLICNYS